MFCKNCGTQVADNAELCPNCGMQLGATQGASQEFRTYSPVWASQQSPVTAAPQPVAYAAPPVSAPKKAKKKKPVLLAVIAIVLVAAVIFGIIGIAGNHPASKAFKAVKKTLFESSEITITVTSSGENSSPSGGYSWKDKSVIALIFGDDLNSSSLEAKNTSEYSDSEYGENTSEESYSFKNGKMYVNGEEMEGDVDTILFYYEQMLSSELGIDIDISEEADKLLNNKLDEEALEELINTYVFPELEKAIKEETGINVDLPEYDEVMKFIEKLLKDKDVRKSLGIKKGKSDNPGTTYSYDVNCGDFATAFFKFVQSKDEYNEYLELIVEVNDYDSAEELIADVVEEAYESDNLQGTFSIKSGRITGFTYVEGNSELSIVIESE